jgi:hypothetical protein
MRKEEHKAHKANGKDRSADPKSFCDFCVLLCAFVVLKLYSNLQTAILPGAEDEAGVSDYKVSDHKRSLLNGIPK